MTTEIQHRRVSFDGTINLPTIGSLIVIVAAAVTFTIRQYNEIDHRVLALEAQVQPNNDRFTRIEMSIRDQSGATKEQLASISSDIRDTNKKLDDLHDQILLSSAGNRPDMRRWAK